MRIALAQELLTGSRRDMETVSERAGCVHAAIATHLESPSWPTSKPDAAPGSCLIISRKLRLTVSELNNMYSATPVLLWRSNMRSKAVEVAAALPQIEDGDCSRSALFYPGRDDAMEEIGMQSFFDDSNNGFCQHPLSPARDGSALSGSGPRANIPGDINKSRDCASCRRLT